LRASQVSVSDAALFFFTQADRLFEAAPTLSGTVSLTIFYETTRTEVQEPLLTGIPYLSIGNISLPGEGSWRFCGGRGNCSESLLYDVRSLFALVPDEESYSIFAEGGSQSGFLGPSQESNVFAVGSSGSFVPVAYFNAIASTPMFPQRTPENTVLTPFFTVSPRRLYANRRVILSFGFVCLFWGY
jgi:hypothetical protein